SGRTSADSPAASDHQAGHTVYLRGHSRRVPRGAGAPGVEDSQGSPAAIPATHREPFTFRRAAARAPGDKGPGRQQVPGVRRCRPRRLPGDRQPEAFSEVLEEYEGNYLPRVHRHRGSAPDRVTTTSRICDWASTPRPPGLSKTPRSTRLSWAPTRSRSFLPARA